MGNDFSDIEGSLEEQERNAEELLQQEKDIENRENILDQALQQLREDVKVCEFLHANYEMTEQAREHIFTKREEGKRHLLEIEQELQNLTSEMNNSQDVLEQLKEMGEDVSEGERTLEKRREWLEACQSKAEIIAEILSLDIGELSFIESSESAGDNNEAERRNEVQAQSESEIKREKFLEEIRRTTFDGVTIFSGESIPNEYEKIIAHNLREASGMAREIYAGIQSEILIRTISEPYNAYFEDGTEGPEGIYFNAERDLKNECGPGSDYLHEVGHLVDFFCTENGQPYSHRENFIYALEKDRKFFLENYSKDDGFKKEIDRLMNRREFVFGTDSLSDILSGLTSYKICGMYSHIAEEWKRPYAIQEETFAHFFEAFTNGATPKLEYLKKYFPNAYSQFEIFMEKTYQYGKNRLFNSANGGNTSSPVRGSRVLERGKTTQYDEER